MLEVTNVKVYDLKESVIASGNAMRLEPVEYTDEEFEKGLARMKRLINASKSGNIRCHDNALTGIRVSFDIKYPQYWTPEAQRYHFFDIVTSSSKMHRLLKMDLDKACNKYVTQEQLDEVNAAIEVYNYIVENKSEAFEFHFRNEGKVIINGYEACLYTAWMFVLSNCPLGLELFMRVSTNYKQLQTMYYQRKNHKLKEDWGNFIDFVEGLPYFKELILGE